MAIMQIGGTLSATSNLRDLGSIRVTTSCRDLVVRSNFVTVLVAKRWLNGSSAISRSAVKMVFASPPDQTEHD
jgi:hypothetical protein